MSKHRTRSRPRSGPPPAPAVETDVVLLDLDQLASIWPRLHQAVARDSAGPSAAKTRSGNHGGEPSTAVIDLETQVALIDIATGVDKRIDQLERILHIEQGWRPSVKNIQRLERELPGTKDAVARVELAELEIRIQRGEVLVAGAWQDLDGFAQAAVLAELARLTAELRDHSRALMAARSNAQVVAAQLARARADFARDWTADAINAIADWYTQLRDRRHPVADQVKKDVTRWLRTARRALNLQTPAQSLGRLCPHHRDRPTELRKVPDVAILSSDVLHGRRQRDGEAPLTWRRESAVFCPHCDTKWEGIDAQRVLMAMIDQADTTDAEVKVLDRTLALDPPTFAHECLLARREQLRPTAVAVASEGEAAAEPPCQCYCHVNRSATCNIDAGTSGVPGVPYCGPHE